jgi:hypothetical protein
MSITKVPRILYQSWEGPLPDIIHNKNMSHLPKDIDYNLFTLKDMYIYLKNNWGKKFVTLFNSYDKIAHKVDLWRYCILYERGGMYMDADCVLINDIEFIFNYDLLFVTNNRGIKDIFNGFLMTPPQNPIYREMLDYMLQIGNSFNNDYYFNCKFLYKVVNKYININLNKHIYECSINNATYKTLLLIDKFHNKINIDNNNWIEKERYVPCYNNIQILIECNKYYPYKKDYNKILIGNSDKNQKIINLNKIYPEDTVLTFIHNFKDTFSYKFNGYNLIITRTDEKSGWGQDLMGYL